jgi:hypothetical protein
MPPLTARPLRRRALAGSRAGAELRPADGVGRRTEPWAPKKARLITLVAEHSGAQIEASIVLANPALGERDAPLRP